MLWYIFNYMGLKTNFCGGTTLYIVLGGHSGSTTQKKWTEGAIRSYGLPEIPKICPQEMGSIWKLRIEFPNHMIVKVFGPSGLENSKNMDPPSGNFKITIENCHV